MESGIQNQNDAHKTVPQTVKECSTSQLYFVIDIKQGNFNQFLRIFGDNLLMPRR